MNTNHWEKCVLLTNMARSRMGTLQGIGQNMANRVLAVAALCITLWVGLPSVAAAQDATKITQPSDLNGAMLPKPITQGLVVLLQDNLARIKNGTLAPGDFVLWLRPLTNPKIDKGIILNNGNLLKERSLAEITGQTELTEANYLQVLQALYDTTDVDTWLQRKWQINADGSTKLAPIADLQKYNDDLKEYRRWLSLDLEDYTTKFNERNSTQENRARFENTLKYFNNGAKTIISPNREFFRRLLVASRSISVVESMFVTPAPPNETPDQNTKRELRKSNAVFNATTQISEYLLLAWHNTGQWSKILFGKDSQSAKTYIVVNNFNHPSIPESLRRIDDRMMVGITKAYDIEVRTLSEMVKGAQLRTEGAQLNKADLLRQAIEGITENITNGLAKLLAEKKPEDRLRLINQINKDLKSFEDVKIEISKLNNTSINRVVLAAETLILVSRKDPRLPPSIRL